MWELLEALHEVKRAGTPAVLVTVVGVQGSAPREISAKMLVRSQAQFWGTIGGGHLEKLALEKSEELIRGGSSQTIRYPLAEKTGQCCGGSVDLYFEVLNQGPRLYVFGAGHVAQCVAQVFEGTPFQVHLIDERSEWLSKEGLPKSTICHEMEWSLVMNDVLWDDKNTYIAVMTHRHDTDFEIVRHILEKWNAKPCRYLGLIGSQAKWNRFKDRLLARGFGQKDLDKVHCPLGLPIGGKAPKEVAVSLASQLLQIHHRGHL